MNTTNQKTSTIESGFLRLMRVRDGMNLKKDQSGQTGNQKYKYADYAQVESQLTPLLIEHHLAIVYPKDESQENIVTTVIDCLDENKPILEVPFPIVVSGPKGPKDVGAAQTYAIRYGTMAAVGVAAEDGDRVEEQDYQGKGYRNSRSGARQSAPVNKQRPTQRQPASSPAPRTSQAEAPKLLSGCVSKDVYKELDPGAREAMGCLSLDQFNGIGRRMRGITSEETSYRKMLGEAMTLIGVPANTERWQLSPRGCSKLFDALEKIAPKYADAPAEPINDGDLPFSD